MFNILTSTRLDAISLSLQMYIFVMHVLHGPTVSPFASDAMVYRWRINFYSLRWKINQWRVGAISGKRQRFFDIFSNEQAQFHAWDFGLPRMPKAVGINIAASSFTVISVRHVVIETSSAISRNVLEVVDRAIAASSQSDKIVFGDCYWAQWLSSKHYIWHLDYITIVFFWGETVE